MPGIVVGIDSSSHSITALEWAMREAAAHGEPLTVVTVEVVVSSGWGGSQVYPADYELRDKAQKAAEEAVAAIKTKLGLGSVSSQVAHHADCPVTIVPD
jgi:nucleotide-binding universal stress UspA family protein